MYSVPVVLIPQSQYHGLQCETAGWTCNHEKCTHDGCGVMGDRCGVTKNTHGVTHAEHYLLLRRKYEIETVCLKLCSSASCFPD